MIADADIESLNADIVQIIGQRVELHQRGRQWIGKCPFHSPDRHPSFEINEAKKAWFCNPCASGGDALSFVMKFHQTDFIGACKILGLEGDSISRKKFAQYRVAVKKIRDDEAAHLRRHREKTESLYEQSRLNSDPQVEIFLDNQFGASRLVEEFIKEIFEDHRKSLREIAA